MPMLTTRMVALAACEASVRTRSEPAETSSPSKEALLPPSSLAEASRTETEMAPPEPPLLVAVAVLSTVAWTVAVAEPRVRTASDPTLAVTCDREVISATTLPPAPLKKPTATGVELTVAVFVPSALTPSPEPPLTEPSNDAVTSPSMRAVGIATPTARSPPLPDCDVACDVDAHCCQAGRSADRDRRGRCRQGADHGIRRDVRVAGCACPGSRSDGHGERVGLGVVGALGVDVEARCGGHGAVDLTGHGGTDLGERDEAARGHHPTRATAGRRGREVLVALEVAVHEDGAGDADAACGTDLRLGVGRRGD